MLGSKLLLVVSAAITLVFATQNAIVATPKAPTLTYLYSCNVTLGTTINYGKGPKGTRVAIPITGGPVVGPKIKGSIINLGADWGVTDAQNNFNPDTRYGLKTDDGANILIQTSGPSQSDGKIHLRMIFETGSSTYSWMNEIVAVGILTAGSGFVAIDAWQLESP